MKLIYTHLKLVINGSSPIPPITRKWTAWHACRAVFSFSTISTKGKTGSIRDRNWFFWLKISYL